MTVLVESKKELVERRDDAIEKRDRRPAGDGARIGYERRIQYLQQRITAVDKAIADLNDKGLKVTVQNRKTGWAALDHGIEKWQKNPSLMLYKLQSSIYKFSWLLIPLSLPFLWLLFFWKRQYRLYDHAIFITYSIAFMSLLFIAITVAAQLGLSEGWIVAASLILPVVHIWRQLKQAYGLGWFSATLRTMVLLFFITVVVSIFLTLLVLLGMT
jgi:hypothetical protein